MAPSPNSITALGVRASTCEFAGILSMTIAFWFKVLLASNGNTIFFPLYANLPFIKGFSVYHESSNITRTPWCGLVWGDMCLFLRVPFPTWLQVFFSFNFVCRFLLNAFSLSSFVETFSFSALTYNLQTMKCTDLKYTVRWVLMNMNSPVAHTPVKMQNVSIFPENTSTCLPSQPSLFASHLPPNRQPLFWFVFIRDWLGLF